MARHLKYVILDRHTGRHLGRWEYIVASPDERTARAEVYALAPRLYGPAAAPFLVAGYPRDAGNRLPNWQPGIAGAGSARHDETASSTTAITVIPKMTIAALGCDPEYVKRPEAPKEVPVARIRGRVDAVMDRKDAEGHIWQALAGVFRGDRIDPRTGEVAATYDSTLCYLYESFHQFMIQEVAARDTGGDREPGDPRAYVAEPPVPFAWLIWAVAAQNPRGYSYRATVLLDGARPDPMGEIDNALGIDPTAMAMPMLSAPTAAAPKAIEGKVG